MLAIARLLEGGERGATAEQFGMSRDVLRIRVRRDNEGSSAARPIATSPANVPYALGHVGFNAAEVDKITHGN